MSFCPVERRDQGPLPYHFHSLSIQVSCSPQQGRELRVSCLTAHRPVLFPPQAVPALGGAMPCASVTWAQLFSLVEKVSINSPAGMLSGSWKLVGTLGLSKAMEYLRRWEGIICAYGGYSKGITSGMSPG